MGRIRAGHRRGRVGLVTLHLAQANGLAIVRWSASSDDWLDGRPAELMFGELEDALVAGAVILMHDGLGPRSGIDPQPRRSSCKPTVELAGMLLKELRRRSLEAALFP